MNQAETDWAAINDETADRFVDYLDEVFEQSEIRRYKRAAFQILGADPGANILDVGCGTGDDALALAERVAPGGRVTGLDTSASLVTEAQRRAPEVVDFRTGDAEALPFPDGVFDGVRADRVLMHVPDPAAAVAEMARVVRPGGRVVVTEPDWDTLVIDGGDPEVGRALMTGHFARVVRHPQIGRSLPRLFAEAGLDEIRVADTKNVVIGELTKADRLFGLATAVEWAGEFGIDGHTAAVWRAALERADDEGCFFCAVTGYTVFGLGSEEGPV